MVASIDDRIVSNQPPLNQPPLNQPAQGQPAQGQPAQGQPAQGQPAQGQPAQNQPAQGQPQSSSPVLSTRLTLLGGFGLYAEDQTVPLAPGSQRLVALLALHEAALHRGYVAGLLWGDSTEAHAQGSLRTTLWKLQMARPGVVRINGDTLVLCPEVDVDVQRSTRLARALVTGRFDEETVVTLLEPKFCSELLPGWYDEWVIVERERYRQLSLYALESVCEHLTSMRRYGAAVLAGLAAVDAEPLRESAHRALMKVHLAEGNLSEAINRYRKYEKIAARDLGVEPSPLMRSLFSQIAGTHSGVDAALTRH